MTSPTAEELMRVRVNAKKDDIKQDILLKLGPNPRTNDVLDELLTIVAALMVVLEMKHESET